MGIIYLGCIGCGFDIAAEAFKIAQILFRDVVTVHGNIDCHGMYSVYDNVVVLVAQNEFCKMAFICGIVFGVNLLNIINGIKRKFRNRRR